MIGEFHLGCLPSLPIGGFADVGVHDDVGERGDGATPRRLLGGVVIRIRSAGQKRLEQFGELADQCGDVIGGQLPQPCDVG